MNLQDSIKQVNSENELALRRNQFETALLNYNKAKDFDDNWFIQAPLLVAVATDRRVGFFPLLDSSIQGIKFRDGFVVGRNGEKMTDGGVGIIDIKTITDNKEAIINGVFALT